MPGSFEEDKGNKEDNTTPQLQVFLTANWWTEAEIVWEGFKYSVKVTLRYIALRWTRATWHFIGFNPKRLPLFCMCGLSELLQRSLWGFKPFIFNIWMLDHHVTSPFATVMVHISIVVSLIADLKCSMYSFFSCLIKYYFYSASVQNHSWNTHLCLFHLVSVWSD